MENGSKLIARGVTLVSGYGVTEAGPVAHPFDGFDADPSDPNARTLEDWQWQRISPLTKPRWMPQGDGTYELQFLVRKLCIRANMQSNEILYRHAKLISRASRTCQTQRGMQLQIFGSLILPRRVYGECTFFGFRYEIMHSRVHAPHQSWTQRRRDRFRIRLVSFS